MDLITLLQRVEASNPNNWLTHEGGIHVFKEDLNVRLVEDREDEDFGMAYGANWLPEGFPYEAQRITAGLYYGLSLVQVFTLIQIQHPSFILPAPNPEGEDPTNWTTTRLKVAVAHILNGPANDIPAMPQIEATLQQYGVQIEGPHHPRTFAMG